jgi:SAM-dependent methyltransferase
MNFEDDPKSIKFYVKRFILNQKGRLIGKTIVDFPAGNGVTTQILKEIGAKPIPCDLFPEYFKVEGLSCLMMDINENLPLDKHGSDGIICQEGIEHFTDQMKAMKAFNRVLKPGGMLLLTTPNYSNLRSKFSYLLGESERFNSMLAPNELDSIWMAPGKNHNEVYYGHIFLIGIQKLRTLGKLAGFRIKKVHFTRIKSTSLLMLPFLWPFIYFSNLLAYLKNMRSNKSHDLKTKKEVYGEIFKLAISPKILVDGHLMVEFEKEREVEEVGVSLKSVHEGFGTT